MKIIINILYRIIKKLIKYFLISLLLGLSMILVIPLFSNSCKRDLDTTNFDIIIVLGAPASSDCKPSVVLKGRIDKGIELFNKGYANKILFTGSSVLNSCTEADVMADYALQNGIPETSILREDRAENTYQNAFYSVAQMKKLKLTSAVIVTSEPHLKRSCVVFSKYDIKYKMIPSNNPKNIKKIRLLFWTLGERMILSYHIVFGHS